MSSIRIAVIGAGPSGLAAAKVLRDATLDVTVFEKSERVGGNWVYRPDPSHSSVYETTHIISSKRWSQFSDFPMPDEYPAYPSHGQLLRYFEAYTERFGLADVIRFGQEVTRAEPIAGGKWNLHVSAASHRVSTQTFDHLLVANGHHWDPRMPEIPGTFAGEYIHAHAYKRNAPFTGRRVLVIGGGNSACDIAVETSRVSAETSISWRRGYYVVPKFMLGKAPDELAAGIRWIPRALRQRLLRLTWRLVTGGNRPYGLAEPDHDILSSHPVINSELLYFIGHGRITPRGDVARFDGQMVHFRDGSAARFDTVIAATGYRLSFPFFPPGIADFEDGGVPRLFLRVFHPAFPTLAFIGLVQPQGCIWPLAEAQSALVASVIRGAVQLPANMEVQVAREVARIGGRYTRSPRHAIEVDYHEHLGALRGAGATLSR